MNDEDAAQLRNDIDALWYWTQGRLLEFNLSKCHQLTLTGRSNRQEGSFTKDGDKPLDSVECEK